MDSIARRCTATNRSGDRCSRLPIPGGSVCAFHGGRAPQTVAAAKARLLAGADLAIDYLLGVLEPRPACAACGRSDADRDPVVVRAAQIVLDRAGFGPSATVEITAAPGLFIEATSDELIARLERLLAEARLLREEEAEVIDAAVVEEPEDVGAIPVGELTILEKERESGQ